MEQVRIAGLCGDFTVEYRRGAGIDLPLMIFERAVGSARDSRRFGACPEIGERQVCSLLQEQ